MTDPTNPQQDMPQYGIQADHEPMNNGYTQAANDGMISQWGATQDEETNHGHRRQNKTMLKDGRFWIGFVIGMIAMFLAILGLASLPFGGQKASDGNQVFQAISKDCRLPDDSSSTMTVGDDDKSINYTLSTGLETKDVNTLGCINGKLGTPSGTVSKMLNTRPIDGMQTDAWDKYRVTWSYSSDDGLSIVYETN